MRGAGLANGDGLALVGRTLYVVGNRSNAVAEVRRSGDLTRGTVPHELTDPPLRVPTTDVVHGSRLRLVNARFVTPPGPDVDYDVVAARR